MPVTDRTDSLAPVAVAQPSGAFSPPSHGAVWQSGAPLGGVRPAALTPADESPRRDLVLTAILLLAAIATGAASLLSWRDVGPIATATETGWRNFDGSLGRGWVAVLAGVLLAVAGVLIAAEKRRAGRIVATATGVALMVFSVLEWGLGTPHLRTGPGPGLWLLFVVGLLVLVAVGALAADPDPADEVAPTA